MQVSETGRLFNIRKEKKTMIKFVAGCIAAAGIVGTYVLLRGRKEEASEAPVKRSSKEEAEPETNASAAEETRKTAAAGSGQERPESRPLHTERQVFRRQTVGTSQTDGSAGEGLHTEKAGKDPAERGWFWCHRKLLLLGGAVMIAGAVIWLNREVIIDFLLTDRSAINTAVDPAGREAVIRVVADPVKEAAVEVSPEMASKMINVCSHLRRLPQGWKASVEKITEAASLGIELPPGFTLLA